mgnify:CR=1 FL=1
MTVINKTVTHSCTHAHNCACVHTHTHPHTLIYFTHTHQPHHYTYPYASPYILTGNTWHACGTVHCTVNPLAMATLLDRNSIGRLNGRKSLDRITALRSITSIGALLDSNLLVRSTQVAIGSYTNRLVQCGMGHEIILCVCVFVLSSCELCFRNFMICTTYFLKF